MEWFLQRDSIKLSLVAIMALFMACNGPTEGKMKEKASLESDEQLLTDSDWTEFIGSDYLIDDQHSYIGFKIKYFGFSPVRGRFNQFDGTLFYDPSNLASLSVEVFVDANSINTGNERRDNDLTSEGSWFDTETFPNIHFKSIKVLSKQSGGFDLIGDLTIKGTTKTDTIAFDQPTGLSKDWAGNDQVDFSGRTTINRQDFGVFGGDFWSSIMENGLTQLSDEVEVEIDIHARRADYQARYEDSDSTDIGRLTLDMIKDHGIDAGLNHLDDIFEAGNLTSGKLSTIGYTLNAWGMHNEALAVFGKRLEHFPDRLTSWNQMGITNLFLRNIDEAAQNFDTMISLDSTNSRAHQYRQLISKMDK